MNDSFRVLAVCLVTLGLSAPRATLIENSAVQPFAWQTATPESQGMSAKALDTLNIVDHDLQVLAERLRSSQDAHVGPA